MEILIPVAVFIFGLIIGSFLNVVILRLDTGLGFGGRSQCFSCAKQLSWYELIPLFSFLFQKGKCRGCSSKISWQYPLVEFLTGVLFLVFFLKIGISLQFLLYLVLIATLIVIAVFDMRHQQIPTIPLIVSYVSVLLLLFVDKELTFFRIGEAALVTLPFLLLWGVSKGRWLGFGDVLLAIGVGLWLGFSLGMGAVLLSFWVGAIFGLILMALSKKHNIKSAIPFGPFIILGSLLSFLYTIDISTLMSFLSW